MLICLIETELKGTYLIVSLIQPNKWRMSHIQSEIKWANEEKVSNYKASNEYLILETQNIEQQEQYA